MKRNLCTGYGDLKIICGRCWACGEIDIMTDTLKNKIRKEIDSYDITVEYNPEFKKILLKSLVGEEKK